MTTGIVSRTVMTGLFLFAPVICLLFAVANVHYEGSLERLWKEFERKDVSVSREDKWLAFGVLVLWFVFQWILALLPDMCSRYIPRYVGGKQQG